MTSVTPSVTSVAPSVTSVAPSVTSVVLALLRASSRPNGLLKHVLNITVGGQLAQQLSDAPRLHRWQHRQHTVQASSQCHALAGECCKVPQQLGDAL